MVQKVGIDAGGSLIKIAYEESGRLHVKTFSNQNMEQVMQWLQLTAPEAVLQVTGGKSGSIKRLATNPCLEIEEFKATVEGTKFLLQQEHSKMQEEFLLVSVGTGTSIYHVSSNFFDRLLGSGIGGGTLIGLGSMLTGETDFHKLVDYATKGNRKKCDLLVSDIYAPDDPPLMGELTASNFGKIANQNKNAISDQVASLFQLIGEAIITLSCQSAAIKQVEQIVFVGSTLNGNAPLKDILTSFQNLFPYEPVFLEKGSFAGAVGAFIHNRNE